MVEEEMVDKVRGLVEGTHSEKIIVPSDVVVADAFAESAEHKEVYVKDIPTGWMVSISAGRPSSCSLP